MDTCLYRDKFILQFNFVIPSRLSSAKFRAGLDRLLAHPQWRKIGARIVLRDPKNPAHRAAGGPSTARFLWAIPPSYSEKRPGYRWSEVDKSGMTLDEAEVGIPKATETGAGVYEIKGHTKWFVGEGTPRTHAEYIKKGTDHPLLSFHMVHFKDATLLGVFVPHSFSDAHASGEIINIIAGSARGEEPPEFFGYNRDPLEDLRPDEGRPTSDVRRLTGWNKVKLIARYIKENVKYKESRRLIYISGRKIRELHETCINELKAEGRKDDLFLTDSDVFTAWITKLYAQHVYSASIDSPSSQTFNLTYVLSGHRRLPSLIPLTSPTSPEPPVYPHNLSCSSGFNTPLFTIANLSVAQLAIRIRRNVNETGTPEQTRKAFSFQWDRTLKKQLDAGAEPDITGYLAVSNWLAGGLGKIDWSGAREEEAKTREDDQLYATFVDSEWNCELGSISRHMLSIVSQRPDGGVWCLLGMRKKDVEALEKAIKEG